MDEASTMTVSPPLPPKARNCRDPVQDARQTTVSIQTIQSLSLPVIPVVGGPAEAGATVFVGGTVPSPTSAPTWRAPEVKKSSSYETRLHQEHQPQSQSVHHQQKHLDTRQPQQQSLQAAHVVKIRINPDDAAGKVVSTVRVTLDENKFESVNGIIGSNKNNNNNNNNNNSSNRNNYNNNNNNNHNSHNNNNNNTNNNNNNTIRKIGQSEASKNGVVLSTTNVNVNGSSSSSSIGSDGCVRISVGSNEVDLQREEMVQREIPNSLNSSSNRTSSCFYYSSFQNGLGTMVMSSGQCSPSDTLDSGTCSDLDGTPPPLPKKKNASSTVILGAGQHVRTGSLTSSGADIDSDEDDDDASNVSCDSLNSSELNAANQLSSAHRLDGDSSDGNHRDEFTNGKSGPFAKSRIGIGDDDDDVSRDSGVTDVASPGNERADRRENSAKEISFDKVAADKIAADNRDADDCSMSVSSSPRLGGRASSSSSSGASTLSKASTTPRVRSPEFLQEIKRSPPMIKECAYEDKKMERMRLREDAVAKELYANYNRGTGNKYLYDDDRFYKFHLNEHHAGEQRQMGNLEEAEGDEFFAGYKMLDREAIRSARGTVRGVKNRVRAGIATFLQQPATKNYKLKDAGKVVVYTTTMGIVRETYYACMKVKQILRTHMVKYEDRDMFMSTEYQAELRDRLQTTIIQVPQLFIDGQYIGDAEVVERLNESGELRRMLKPYKSPDACTTCQICGGYRLLPCPVCNGSKKSVHRNDFTTEFVALKCMNCDEVGLVRCQHC